MQGAQVSYASDINLPDSVDGSLDLSLWNQNRNPSIPLAGSWQLYWNHLETEEELRTGELFTKPPTALIKTGTYWRDAAPGVAQDFGYVTYVLKIKGLLATPGEYGLMFSQFNSNYKAYFFDSGTRTLSLLGSVGTVAKDSAGTQMQNLKKIYPLPSLNAEGGYVIVQTSAYRVVGGLALVPEIGRYASLKTEEERNNWQAFWILGMFCLLFISNLSLFALRREDKPSLVMALFTFLMGLRFFSTEGMYARFDPEPRMITFIPFYYVVVIALPLGMALYLQFFSLTFPKHYPRWALRSSWAVCSIYFASMLAGLFYPGLPSLFSTVMLIMLAFGGIMFVRLLGLVIHKQRGAAISLLGITLLVSAMANDVFIYLRFYEFIYIGHYGMIAFIFAQSLVVGSNFAFAFQTSDRLSKHLQIEVDRQTRDVKTILRTIHQGILSVRTGLKVGDDYSSYLTDILGRKDIANQLALDLVFGPTNLDNEKKAMIASVLESSINEMSLNFEMNAQNLIRECIYTDPSGKEKILLVDWDPVVNEKTDLIEKILVTLRDVTELKAMEEKNKQHQRDMELITEVIEVPPDRFEHFLNSGRRFLAENERLLATEDQPSAEVLKIIFINLHTIKGAARTYRFASMTSTVHDAEHFIASIQKGSATWDYQQVWSDLQKVLFIFSEYERINRDKLKRVENKNMVRLDLDTVRENIKALASIGELKLDHELTPFVDQVRRTFFQLYYQDISNLISDVSRLLPQLARDLNKPQPEVVLKSLPVGLTKEAVETLHDVFIHILRNIMDHGIEAPGVRESQGKPAFGKISFFVSKDTDDYLLLRVQDDGQGIRLDRLRELGLQKGLLVQNQTHSATEIANLVFLAGFSTAKGLTEVSGRGVGMSAVREYIEKVGGRVDLTLIRSDTDQAGVPFCLNIHLPPALYTILLEDSLAA